MKADKVDTQIFKKKNHGINLMHGIVDEGIRMTRASKFKDEELANWNRQDVMPTTFWQGIMGKELQLFLAICWLIVAAICSPFETESLFRQILGAMGLVFGFLCVLMFVIFHGVETSIMLFGYLKRGLKVLFDVVTYPVR